MKQFFRDNFIIILTILIVALLKVSTANAQPADKVISVGCDLRDNTYSVYTFIEYSNKSRVIIMERINMTFGEDTYYITINDDYLKANHKKYPDRFVEINRKTGEILEGFGNLPVGTGSCKKWVKPTVNKF